MCTVQCHEKDSTFLEVNQIKKRDVLHMTPPPAVYLTFTLHTYITLHVVQVWLEKWRETWWFAKHWMLFLTKWQPIKYWTHFTLDSFCNTLELFVKLWCAGLSLTIVDEVLEDLFAASLHGVMKQSAAGRVLQQDVRRLLVELDQLHTKTNQDALQAGTGTVLWHRMKAGDVFKIKTLDFLSGQFTDSLCLSFQSWCSWSTLHLGNRKLNSISAEIFSWYFYKMTTLRGKQRKVPFSGLFEVALEELSDKQNKPLTLCSTHTLACTHTQSYLTMGLKSATVVLERCTLRIFAPLLHRGQYGQRHALQFEVLYVVARSTSKQL